MFGALFFAGHAFLPSSFARKLFKTHFRPPLHPCISLLMAFVARYISVSAYLWHL